MWDDVWLYYLSGMMMDEFVNFVIDLSFGVCVVKFVVFGIDFFCFIYDELFVGWLVIIGWY